jgi:hypothetical protein
MQQYRVIALAVSGLSSKIHRSGEVVREDHFPPGRAADLVKQGFLMPLSDKSAAAAATKHVEAEKTTVTHMAVVDGKLMKESETPAGMPTAEEMTVKEIKVRLDLKGITYDPKANKQKLYALLTQEQ